MTRSTASLFVPVFVLIAIAVGLFLKPWQHSGGGSAVLPALAPAVTTAGPAPVHQDGTIKLSAGGLEVLLGPDNYSSTSPVAPVEMHWSCKADPSGHWDYTCTLRETGSVWGYDVDGSQITSRRELSWAGHKLIP